MRLLYLHDTPVDCDTANVIQVLHMCYAFAEVGVEVTLAIPANGNNSLHIRKIIKRKIGKDVDFNIRPYRKITFGGKFVKIGAYPGIKQIVKTENADYCFVRNPIFVNAPIKYNIPTIFEVHEAIFHDNPIWNFFWKRK